jgi:hypothetical protein
LPEASSKPIGALARYSRYRLVSTWTFVAAWRSLVVDVPGLAEFQEQPLAGQGLAPAKFVERV